MTFNDINDEAIKFKTTFQRDAGGATMDAQELEDFLKAKGYADVIVIAIAAIKNAFFADDDKLNAKEFGKAWKQHIDETEFRAAMKLSRKVDGSVDGVDSADVDPGELEAYIKNQIKDNEPEKRVWTDRGLKIILKAIDKDGSGQVELYEFLHALGKIKKTICLEAAIKGIADAPEKEEQKVIAL